MIQKVYTEEWRPVVGYEGLYEVSNLGRVKSLRRNRVLMGGSDKDGYKRLALCYCNKREYKFVHRIVAEAFIPNPEGLPQVNHKDENKTNNAVWNLEWCDAKYNNNYGTCRSRIAKKQSKPLIAVSIANGSILRFKSLMEARANGFDDAHRAAKGIIKQCKGYKWFYA